MKTLHGNLYQRLMNLNNKEFTLKRSSRILLKRKQKRLQEHLLRWAQKNDILFPGEQLTLELCVKRVFSLPILTNDKNSPKPPKLPSDFGCSHWIRTYQMTPKDWESIEALPWNEEQGKLVALLKSRNNGPIHVSDFISNGIAWKHGWTNRFNTVIRHNLNQRGSRYKLERLDGPEKYYVFSRTNDI